MRIYPSLPKGHIDCVCVCVCLLCVFGMRTFSLHLLSLCCCHAFTTIPFEPTVLFSQVSFVCSRSRIYNKKTYAAPTAGRGSSPFFNVFVWGGNETIAFRAALNFGSAGKPESW